MAVDFRSPAMRELVPEDAGLELLGSGFTFTEGPLWNPEGFLLFSDMPGDVRRRWDRLEGVSEVANPSNKGNGMTFDLDGRIVVCEHVTSSVVRMDPDGSLENGRIFAEGIGTASLEVGDLVDGMKLDERGNVWVTGPGGVCVFDPQGEHIGTVEVPEPVGNLNWGGAGWDELFICASTSLYRLRCSVSGNRLHYMR